MSKKEETTRVYKPKKVDYINSFKTALADYKKILFVDADNVGSAQMANIRMKLRELDAILLMGKNTLMKTAIKQYVKENPKVELLLPLIQGNCGLIFTNGSLVDVKKLIVDNKVKAAAKPGAITQSPVVIPAQNTGMEPTKTSFFQALDIPTKITRGTVEIISDFPLLKTGDKVSASQAQLLQVLKIYPLNYGLEAYSVYDDGEVYDAEVLDLTDDDLLNGFYEGCAELAAFSLELNRVNEATVPHSVANAFKDLVSIALETSYEFEQSKKIKEFLADPSKFIKAAPSSEKKEEVVEEEEEEEEEDGGAMASGLFGDDDDDEDDSDDESSE